jgi:hypothetical protein
VGKTPKITLRFSGISPTKFWPKWHNIKQGYSTVDSSWKDSRVAKYGSMSATVKKITLKQIVCHAFLLVVQLGCACEGNVGIVIVE